MKRNRKPSLEDCRKFLNEPMSFCRGAMYPTLDGVVTHVLVREVAGELNFRLQVSFENGEIRDLDPRDINGPHGSKEIGTHYVWSEGVVCGYNNCTGEVIGG